MAASLWVNGGGASVINPGNSVLSALGTTWVFTLSGVQADETYHTVIYDAGVISHLGIHIITNPITPPFSGSTLTCTLMKNGIATALSVTISPGLTGFFVNNSDTVSVSPGDTVHIRCTHNNVFENAATCNMASVIFTPTNTNICVTQVGTNQTSAFLGIGSGTTRYFALHGFHGEGSGTQEERQDCVPIAATGKNARVRIIANTLNGTTTCTLQKNGVDTAIVITFAAGESGWKEHTANTVSFLAEDKAGWKVVTAGSSGGITFISAMLQFHSEEAEWFLGNGQQARTPSGTNTVMTIGGDNVGDTEAIEQWSATLAGRCKGLCINVRVNSNVADSFLRFRKNGANGNSVVTIPAGQTGFFDAAGEDTWTGADLLSLLLTSASAGALTYSTIDWIGSFEFEEEGEAPVNQIDCPHGSYVRTINLTASYVRTPTKAGSYYRTSAHVGSYARTLQADGSSAGTITGFSGSF